MKVLFLNEALTFFVIPREFPENGDVLSLYLRNEFTNEEINPEATFEIVRNKLSVTLTSQPTDFSSQSKYEATIKRNDEIIYLGKILVLEADTDLQNYEYNTQANVKFDYK